MARSSLSKQRMGGMLLAMGLMMAVVDASVTPYNPARKLMQGAPEVGTRLDIAEIDAMDELDPYRVMMLLAWQEMTTSPRTNSILSYWRLAGIHGKSWAYNGTPPPTQGFCRHQSPGFGPWHRAYLRQFELGLLAAAERAANKFTDPTLRKRYTQLAHDIRLPYWDWTSPSVPSILTASRVTVLDADGQAMQIRNPFSGYTFVGAAGDGRGEGKILRRGSQWATAMARSSRRFGMEMASFLRSNTWRCSYLTGIGCGGNLESTHNEIHNILGGTAGEMATVPYAGFDPLFWLHHCMVDRVLWLFQNNGGQWGGATSYSPFNDLGGDVSQISTLGYTYSAGRPIGGVGGSRRSQRRNADNDVWMASRDQVDVSVATTGGSVNSAAATAAVAYAIEQWTGNYTGYAWSMRLQEFDQHQMDKAVHIYVYLNKPGLTTADGDASTLPAKVTMLEDFNELRLKPNYCGSVAGFNEHIHAADANHVISRAVDLTECLRKAGLQTDVPPAVPNEPARGPSKAPIKLAELRLVALTADGEDVSDKYDFGKPVVSWSLPVTRTAGAVRAVTSALNDPVEAEALASPTVFPAQQEIYSHVQGIADDGMSS